MATYAQDAEACAIGDVDMGLKAAGNYLYFVRYAQNLRLGDVATVMTAATGIPLTKQQVHEIEGGRPPSEELLIAFANAVHADMGHVRTLLATSEPSEAMMAIMLQDTIAKIASST